MSRLIRQMVNRVVSIDRTMWAAIIVAGLAQLAGLTEVVRWCGLLLGLTTIGAVLNLVWDMVSGRDRSRWRDSWLRPELWFHRHYMEMSKGLLSAFVASTTPEDPSRLVRRARRALYQIVGGEPAPLRHTAKVRVLHEVLSRFGLWWLILATTSVMIVLLLRSIPDNDILPDLHRPGWSGAMLWFGLVYACSHFVAQPLWTIAKFVVAPRFEIGIVGFGSKPVGLLGNLCTGHGQVTTLVLANAGRPVRVAAFKRGRGTLTNMTWCYANADTSVETVIADLASTVDLLILASDAPAAEVWRRVAAEHLPTDRIWMLSDVERAATADRCATIDARDLTPLMIHRMMSRLNTRSTGMLLTSFAYGNPVDGVLKAMMGIALVAWLFASGRPNMATYLALGLVFAVHPNLVGRRRRSLAKTTVLRAPRWPRASKLLSHHAGHAIWLEALWVGISVKLVFVSFLAATEDWPLFVRITAECLLLGWLVLQARLFAAASLRIVKWALDARFRIVMFRRNAPTSGGVSRRVLMPVFGAYGQLVAIADPELVHAKAGSSAHSEDVLSEVTALLSSADEAALGDGEPRGWCRIVQEQLDVADLVVFHWQETPTANMRWELAQAVFRLPPERLLFITTRELLPAIKEIIAAHLRVARLPNADQDAPRSFVIDRDLDDLSNTRIARAWIADIMATLRETPRARPT